MRMCQNMFIRINVTVAVMMAVLLAGSVHAQRNLKDIPDPDVNKQLAAMEVAEGFEINLFASEPDVVNPIHMNFDAQGRLWVASSPIYPHIEPGAKANDNIYVLEDTDGDGKADKSTVFADGLLIPTAVVPGDGGVYVANSTEMLHFKDTNGDGKADERRVVLSGFGTEDTHHILHTFMWGPGGGLHFNQSIYIHSHIETPWGVKRLLGGGIWYFRPESLKLDVYMKGFVNTWGHQFDRWGQSFCTDGAFGEGINYGFPGAVFISSPGAKRILKGLNPGQPKHCSLAILSGRHLPEAYRGTMVANDFRGNRINRFVVTEEGSGYSSRQVEDLVKSTHMAFRPVDVKMGPDGAIYVADWYNPIIQHGEVDFRDERRDKKHGRIWRISYKKNKPLKMPVIVGAPIKTLLGYLALPEDFTRLQAKQELKTRDSEKVAAALGEWVKTIKGDNADAIHQRLEALWAYETINVVNEELLRSMLVAKDHRARAAAVRVLSHWIDRVNKPVDLLERAVADEHPRVRLEAVNAMRLVPSARTADLTMRALDKPVDYFLDYAIWYTIRDLQPYWIERLRAGETVFEGKVDRLVFALKAAENPSVLQSVVRMIQEGKVAEGDRQALYDLVAAAGGPNELRLLYDLGMSQFAKQPAQAADLFRTLFGAFNTRKVKPAGELNGVIALIDAKQEALVQVGARLTGAWKVQGALEKLQAIVTGKDVPNGVLQAGVDGLSMLGGQASRDILLKLTESDQVGLKLMSVVGLINIDINLAARQAVEVFAKLPDGVNASDVFSAFIQEKNGPDVLKKALNGKTIPSHVAIQGVRVATTSGRKVEELVGSLNSAGGIGAMVQQLEPEQLNQLVEEVKTKGNAANGQKIFHRQSLACVNCHAIAGAGGLVGPDLVSIGASAPIDYLIESLLNPSKKIKEGYHMVSVERKDGQVQAGVLIRKTDKALLLRDPADNEISIPLGQVKKQSIVPVSLMPPGLTASLRRDEFIDLVRFMAELGKEGAYKAPTERYVRRWQVIEGGGKADNDLRKTSIAFAANDTKTFTWSSRYSDVSGELPLARIPKIKRFAGKTFGFARYELDVSTAGEIGLRFNSVKGLSMWVDQKIVQIQPETKLTIPEGRHVLTLAVDFQNREQDVRVEVVDIEGAQGRASAVGGK